ncbi:DUF6161 domain-containing protein [uncultured Microbulbifer sp.]|uniref:DUF6161 domain-containing protein n=1 Tax=uncultured Microbulbifer sp. TaxID=348147 RepID=UPI0026162D28|nr:DUF6161 domain-containing protein [uncultured Microbulbifer sp.]
MTNTEDNISEVENGPYESQETLTLPLGENNFEIRFDSAHQLQDFYDREIKFWSWITRLEHNTNAQVLGNFLYSKIVLPIIEPIKKIAKQWAELEYDARDTQVESLKNVLDHVNFPFSNRLVGKYINEHHQSEPLICIHILHLCCAIKEGSYNTATTQIMHAYSDISVTPPNGRFIGHRKAYFDTIPYSQKANRILERIEIFGSDENLEGLVKEAKHTRNEIDNIYFTSTERQKAFVDWQSQKEIQYDQWTIKEKRKAKRLGLKVIRKILNTKNEYLKECSEIFEDSQRTVETARDTYLSQVELDAAVTYWNTKKTEHKSSKQTWLGSIIVLLVILGLSPLLSSLLFEQEDFPKDDLILHAFQPAVLFSSFLFISIISYLVKIASKQYSTHTHLYLEAVERQTMLKTYLALMNEGKLSEQEDRKVALDSLFRSAQTGIVADHGGISPIESIVKIIEKQVKPAP